MRTQRIALALTLINLLLLVFLLAEIRHSRGQEVLPVLRGRALQIVDDQGRVRAEILVHGPEKIDGKLYPETTLFRLADPKRGHLVKLTASDEGAALGLWEDSNGGVQLYEHRVKGNFVRVVNKDGKEQVLKP